ncbi:MAG: amidohydrolase family protein [Mycoplasmataceae bacterium]|nr:amidohydrolase family protein [Mycoplasmataceae bacterium]
MLIIKNTLLKNKLVNIFIEGKKIKYIKPYTKCIETSKEDEVIDAGENLILPGLIDSHLHTFASSKNNLILTIDFSDITSLKEIEEKLIETVKKNNEKKWIIGKNLHAINFRNEKNEYLINRQFLDKISKDSYIYITSICLHVGFVNEKVIKDLKLCNDKDTNIETGIVLDKKLGEISFSIPCPDMQTILLNTLNEYKKVGLTSVISNDLGWGKESEEIFKAFSLLSKEKKMPVRVFQQVKVNNLQEAKERIEYFKYSQYGLFNISMFKIICDGSFGAKTASLIDTYKDSNEKGRLLIETNEIYKIVEFANQKQIPVAIHTIGDNALKTVIDALKKIRNKHIKNQIVHCSLVNKKLLADIKKLNIQLSIQPCFLYDDYEFIKNILDDKQLKYWQLCKTFIKEEINIAGSSDSPICSFNPFTGIDATVNRKIKGIDIFPSEKVTLQEGIDMYTKNAAKLTSLKDIGEIKEGFFADLIIVNQNLYKIDSSQIINTKPIFVITDGKIVYKKANK